MTKNLASPHIRKLTLADLPTLLALSKQTFTESFGPKNTEANMQAYMQGAFNELQLIDEVNDKASVFFLLEYGDKVVGYVKLRTGKKQEALGGAEAIEIQRLYLLRAYTGLGLGNLLMQAGLEEAKRLGYQVVWLGVWEHNLGAIAFYQRCGFEFFSSYIFQFGNEAQTDLLMKKML